MKIWAVPVAIAQEFASNEYVAACEDIVNKYYVFKCDAAGGLLGIVYEETNGTDGLQTGWGGDELLTPAGYHRCGATHYVPVNSTDFVNGYYLTSLEGIFGGGDFVTPVVIWKGDNSDNVHCTKNLKVRNDIVTGNKS